jgi:hypothetical protein
MDVLHSTRQLLVLAYLGLPLILITIVVFLGMGLSSLGLIFLSVGQIFLVPTLAALMHYIPKASWNVVPTTDISQLVPSAAPVPSQIPDTHVFPSWWVAQMAFFFGYIISNASTVVAMEKERGANDLLVQNRKSKASAILTISILLFLLLVGIRLFITRTEKLLAVTLSSLLFLGVGAGWFKAAEACGVKAADVFGIVSQMLVPKQAPRVCMYNPTPATQTA